MRTPIVRAERVVREPIAREAISRGDFDDLREADNDSAPWSPVPTFVAREFIRRNDDAAIEVVFPTVYEEDRTAKLKDLITAQSAGAISHQRMAEQIAKELGFEEYDYKEELKEIEQEMKTLPEGILGAADQIAGAGDAGQGNGMGSGDGNFGGPAAQGIKTDQPFSQQHRAEISGTATARFRKLQRQVEANQRETRNALIKIVQEMRESARILTQTFASRATTEAAAKADSVRDLRELVATMTTQFQDVARTTQDDRATEIVKLCESMNAMVERIASMPPPAVHVEPPVVTVNVPKQPVPPAPTVTILGAPVKEVSAPASGTRRDVVRDKDGLITAIIETPVTIEEEAV